MTTAERLARFQVVVARPADAIELDVAALTIGDWDGEVDVAGARAELDAIAARVGAGRDHAALARTLYAELGFHGNATDYYDPRNSFLADVLARRTGIPISLGVLYLEVARRIGLPARGVGFPGHFLVRVDDPAAGAQVIDPFNGGAVLADADLRRLLAQVAGEAAVLDDAALASVTTPQILARMLLNLAGIYGRRGDLFRSLEVLERLALIDRDNPRLARDLEQLRERVAAMN
jgi:regulator of sirC expression with transglutaminase-like and TPR domain